MPKSIIREIDNSSAGITLTSNFAVFVPGYMNPDQKGDNALIKEAKKDQIYFEDDNIYKLTSQEQFIKYIGKFGGKARAAEAPILEQMGEGTAFEDRYSKHLYLADFYNPDNPDLQNYKFYFAIEVNSGEVGYGENGRLLKTIELEGNLIKTYRFIEQTIDDLDNDFETIDDQGAQVQLPYTANSYFKIKKGNEGCNALERSNHIGNQIAYELLGLGYTVYFKPLVGNSTPEEELSSEAFWEPLKNKSTYRIRYLVSGGCYDPNVYKEMIKIARLNSAAETDGNEEETPTIEDADVYGNKTGRGDIIVLADIDEDGISGDRGAILHAFGERADLLPKSKYCAIFAPRVAYKLAKDDIYTPDDGTDVLFPASFHYLACAALAQSRYAEWYAVAGYTRGISSKAIKYTTFTFGDIDINTLAPRKANAYTDSSINLILSERGNYYLWGNRTSEVLDSKGLRFSHFLNIRQLCCTIKQVLYDATRNLTFDPNSDLLWINFVNAISPTLESMKADQGIAGYKISRVATDKKALLKAKIRIVPIEALEDFDISIYLEDSLSGIVLTADEEEAEIE